MTDERIEEEKVNDDIYYRLKLSDGTTACTLQIDRYHKTLVNIWTNSELRRRGYGRKLFQYVEAIAKSNGIKVMKTTDIDSLCVCAVGFFRAMGFNLKSIENNSQFLEGEKVL
jgi:GNAT superfamily N-acetyltransferase